MIFRFLKQVFRNACVLFMIVALGGCYKSNLHGESDGQDDIIALDNETGEDSAGPDTEDIEAVENELTFPDLDVPDVIPDLSTPDSVFDYVSDASFDWPSVDTHHEELPPLPYVPQCGNGVLDDGEECDDRNRLNGDGCDWLCRNGDGDPPPEPDPDVDPYVPAGEPIYLPGSSPWGWSLFRLPVQWTGADFATAFEERHEDDSNNVRFRRFAFNGELLGADWVYPTENPGHGTELVWTGSGFGLFFVDNTRGIFYLPLGPDGKPRGSPMLVEPDPQARSPAADLTPTGFMLAWVTEGSGGLGLSWCGDWEGPIDTIRMRLVDFDGFTSGPPVMIEEMAGGPADVATGEDGFGVTMMVNSSPETPSCSFRFVRVSSDLAEAVYSGILSNGPAGDVGWLDGHYTVAWPHFNTMEGGRSEQCVAKFSPTGILERPPVCNDVTAVAGDGFGFTRISAGDGGLALVFASDSDFRLSYLRTDQNGSAVDIPRSVVGPVCNPYEMFCSFGPYGTTWTDNGFAVLFIGSIDAWDVSRGMILRHFIAAE